MKVVISCSNVCIGLLPQDNGLTGILRCPTTIIHQTQPLSTLPSSYLWWTTWEPLTSSTSLPNRALVYYWLVNRVLQRLSWSTGTWVNTTLSITWRKLSTSPLQPHHTCSRYVSTLKPQYKDHLFDWSKWTLLMWCLYYLVKFNDNGNSNKAL